MASAMKCDICGNYFDLKNEGFNHINLTNSYPSNYKASDFDLCPECMMEFNDWYLGKRLKEEENESN